MPQRTLSRRRAAAEPEDDYDGPDSAPRDFDEDEPPRRGRARGRARSDEEPRRSRTSRGDMYERVTSDHDEDDAPRGRRSRSEAPAKEAAPRSTGKGWKAFKEKREATSDYVKNYVLPEEPSLIKILDAEPFSVYAEHWIDEIREGKRSFVCIGDGCPLCDIGEKARVYALFNILDLADPDNPKVRPWKVSSMTSDTLENYSADDKTSPLDREDLYWSVWKTGGGKKGRTQVNVNPVKARDVEEDWDIVPFSEEELEEFELLTEDDVLTFSSKKALRAVADDLS